MTSAACFHCGLALGRGRFPVLVDGVSRDTCCAGCQAIARTIVENGLAAYYRNRTAPPPEAKVGGEVLEDLGLYDLAEVQRTFVRPVAAGEREASLLLNGVTCAACTWLIEQRLLTMPGVVGVSINYGARRARVRWQEGEVKLSAILRAIGELGYSAEPYDAARSEDHLRAERRGMLWRLFVAGFGMMQVMMYAYPAYIAGGDMTGDVEQLMRLASLVITTPVALWAASPFYAGAWRDLRNRALGMDVPVAGGILVAYVASVMATVQGAGDVYFDSVSMFVFLLLAARYLEMTARAKALDAQQRLLKLTPAAAERLDRFPDPVECRQVPVAVLEQGDIVAVRPGAVIPADGVVIDGVSAADESLFTGESRPVGKRIGDRVTGGSVNVQSPLTVRVERVGEETVLAAIVRLMDRAHTAKPRVALAAERAARGFVAVVLVGAAVAAGAWYVVDPARAIPIAIAVLVITCPCALSLAAPAVAAAASGALYRSGVLVTRPHALETLTQCTHVVFDKTGTLTTGGMRLVDVVPLGTRSNDQCLAIAAALEAQSEHPIGRAIFNAVEQRTSASDVLNYPGEGVQGRIDGREYRIGKAAFVAGLHGLAEPEAVRHAHVELTAVALGDTQGWIALLTFAESLRSDAREVVARLEAEGKTVCLLSGDRADRVRDVAAALGIENVRGDATPQQKLDYVAKLQGAGAVVAMVGDGLNDAPVLARAQVSIAMRVAADLAHSSADVILMSDRLRPLSDAFRVARVALRTTRENLTWAAAYNVVAIPLAVLGYVTPVIAAIGMSVSSLAVVLNALRLTLMPRLDTSPLPPHPDSPRPLRSPTRGESEKAAPHGA
jgi:Cu2+-exporting ATPase